MKLGRDYSCLCQGCDISERRRLSCHSTSGKLKFTRSSMCSLSSRFALLSFLGRFSLNLSSGFGTSGGLYVIHSTIFICLIFTTSVSQTEFECDSRTTAGQQQDQCIFSNIHCYSTMSLFYNFSLKHSIQWNVYVSI